MCVSLVYDSTWRCYESTILRQCDCECVWTIVAHTPKTHWVELSGFYSVVGRLNVVFSDNIKFRSELRYCRTAAACSIGLRYENTHTQTRRSPIPHTHDTVFRLAVVASHTDGSTECRRSLVQCSVHVYADDVFMWVFVWRRRSKRRRLATKWILWDQVKGRVMQSQTSTCFISKYNLLVGERDFARNEH